MKRISYAMRDEKSGHCFFIRGHKGKYEGIYNVPTLFGSHEEAIRVLQNYYDGACGNGRAFEIIQVNV